MSKIGKKPVIMPSGVTAEIVDGVVQVDGPNGKTSVPLLEGVKVAVERDKITFAPAGRGKQTRSNWGTMRALVQNAVKGAAADFTKELIIEGIGYRAEVQGQDLILNIGLSHLVRFPIPQGIKITTEKNVIKVAGADAVKVGDTAAQIRHLKKPEPYKGKGIRYAVETIRRKAGKKAVTTGGARPGGAKTAL